MFVYNPIYPDADITFSSADIGLPFFKYPYLFDAANVKNKIEVVAQLGSTANTNSTY